MAPYKTFGCKHYVLTPIIALVGMTMAGIAFGSGTNTFTMTASNTPITAYDYETSDNWEDSDLGAPLGAGASATFNAAADAAAPYFVKLPADFKISALYMNKGAFLLGNCLKFNVPGSTAGGVEGNVDYPYGGILFGDLKVTKLYSSGSVNAMRSFELAGHFRPGAYEGGTDVGEQYAHTGLVTLRHDLFADSANPMREGAYHYTSSFIENGGFVVYGPKGAPANDSSWNLTSGKVYAEYAGTGDHAVVPGQVVTGTGVQPGTFVRYVFPGTKWIALSAQATSSASAASLHFTAITPSVTEYWPEYRFFGGERTWTLAKFREEDGLTMIVKTALNSDTGGGDNCSQIGLTATQVSSGLIPGNMVVSNVTFSSGAMPRKRLYSLRNCRIEFVNPFTWNASLDQYLGPTGIRFELNKAAFVAEITIPEGKEVDLKAFCNLKGTLVKKGTGTLVVPMFNTTLPGTIEVAEGTLDLRRGTTLGASDPLELGSLKIATGATLKLPADGMSASNLVAAAGSFIEGPGTLSVIKEVDGVPSVTGGARVSFAIPAPSASDVFPASDRWLHLDASVANTVTTNAAGEVTKWVDVDGTGEYAQSRAAGTQSRPSGNPMLRLNAVNSLPMVDLGEVSFTNVSYGVSSVLDRSLTFVKSSGTVYGAPASDTSLPFIKTALFVVGSEYGGGPLLSAVGSSFPNYGMQHAPSTDFTTAIISTLPSSNWGVGDFSNDKIDNGTTLFRTNGVSIYPREVPFSGGFDVISYANSTGRKSNGLGASGSSTNAEYPLVANGLLYGEVVLFTNRLSLAQIEEAEAYLSWKWLGRAMPHYYKERCDMLTVGTDSTLVVTGGGMIETSAIGGCGTVEGNLALDENAVFNVAVDGASVPTLTVAGNVTLPANATVVVSGELSDIALGSYPILSAGEIAGSVRDWDVVCESERRRCRVSVGGNGMVLTVCPNGMSIFVR